MVGDQAGVRLGAVAYNAVHTYVGPLLGFLDWLITLTQAMSVSTPGSVHSLRTRCAIRPFVGQDHHYSHPFFRVVRRDNR